MKIILEGLFGKNIQLCCEKCNCVYEIENKEDWAVNWVSQGVYNFDKCEFSKNDKKLIPEYVTVCPRCSHSINFGSDIDDEIFIGGNAMVKNIIMKRKDWKTRYKIEPKNKQ